MAMTPEEAALLKRVAERAIEYVAVVSNPPAAPAHKAQDAERRAFDALDEAVTDAVAADMDEQRRLGDPDADPEEEGAWR
jgi:uncharacterized protein YbjT (DUF2867 family)